MRNLVSPSDIDSNQFVTAIVQLAVPSFYFPGLAVPRMDHTKEVHQYFERSSEIFEQLAVDWW